MFIVSKEAMQSAMSLRERIADTGKRVECIAELENMIRIYTLMDGIRSVTQQ